MDRQSVNVATHRDRSQTGPSSSAASPWTLPALLDHFNRHDMKVFLRVWVATWVSGLLMFIQPSLEHIGVATFFAPLTLYIVPPVGVFTSYLLAAVSVILGICAAWVWGIITMKAALAARPASQRMATLAALQQAAVQRAAESGTSPQEEAVALVFNGFALDARVSTVYFVMICAFLYMLARLRMWNPRFVGAQIFGTIVIDIVLLYGPSQPNFIGDLANALVTPGAIGVGLGVACWLLLFPHSTSYAVLGKLESVLRTCNVALVATEKHLSREALNLASLGGSRAKIIGEWNLTKALMGLLPVDTSRCYWSADDIAELHGLVRETLLKSVSLFNLHITRLSASNREETAMKQSTALGNTSAADGEKPGFIPPGQHHLNKVAALISALHTPEHFALNERSTDVLRDTTCGLLKACMSAIDLTARCIHKVNSRRWLKRLSEETSSSLQREAQDTLAALRSARALCSTNTAEALLDAYADLFDENGIPLPPEESNTRPASLRGIITCMVLEEHILDISMALERLLERVDALLRVRKECKIWVPVTVHNALSWLRSSPSDPTSEEMPKVEDTEANATPKRTSTAYEPRIPAHIPGRTAALQRSRFASAVIGLWKWLTNADGLYAARVVIVTIATAIPAVIPHTAGFYYREKGLWMLITAQLTLVPYMAEIIVSSFWRTVGTILGGVLAMLSWYIGSGSGNGNPYGLAAITAPVTAILVWLRIFSPHTFVLAAIMAGATFTLTVGYSYDNHHIPQYGLIGKGYEVFWKRLVTVLAGLLAAVVVQLFPKPPSATAHACRGLTKSVGAISDQYALLLQSQRHASESSAISLRAEQLSLHVTNSLSALGVSIQAVSVEISLGPFSRTRLRQLLEECKVLNQSLVRLLSVAATLPPDLRPLFESATGMLDDRVIADVMAVLHIVQLSFKGQAPLPQRLPTPLAGTFFDAWQRQRHVMISKELIRKEGYPRFCVALSSYLTFFSTIDNIVLLLAQTLGESHSSYD